jgi:hypothetical protein
MMGWFQTEDGLTLGDAPLDVLHAAVRELAGAYQEAVDRPPTLAEVERLVRVVLAGCTPEHVQDLVGKEVSAVTIKTKKAATKHKWAVGDAFAVPLPDGTFGFGRVVWRVNDGEAVVELLRHRARVPLAGPDALSSGRIFPPVYINAHHTFETGRWPIYGHDPGFRAPDHDDLRIVLWQGADRHQLFTVEKRLLGSNLPKAQAPADAIDFRRCTRDSGRPNATEQELQVALDAAGIRGRGAPARD